jgi:hypothetical protein
MSLTVDHPWFLVLFAFIALHLLPTYLKGLWSACRSKGAAEKKWEVVKGCTFAESDWNKCLSAFDAVCAFCQCGSFPKLHQLILRVSGLPADQKERQRKDGKLSRVVLSRNLTGTNACLPLMLLCFLPVRIFSKTPLSKKN